MDHLMAKVNLQMRKRDHHMKALGKKEDSMAKESHYPKLRAVMKDSLFIVRDMVRVNNYILMEKSMRDSGMIIDKKDKGSLHGQMVKYILENSKTTNLMVLAKFYQKELFKKVNGKMVNLFKKTKKVKNEKKIARKMRKSRKKQKVIYLLVFQMAKKILRIELRK